MKTIRHLMTIVFLLCGLTALGSERGYDRNDLDRYVMKELAESLERLLFPISSSKVFFQKSALYPHSL